MKPTHIVLQTFISELAKAQLAIHPGSMMSKNSKLFSQVRYDFLALLSKSTPSFLLYWCVPPVFYYRFSKYQLSSFDIPGETLVDKVPTSHPAWELTLMPLNNDFRYQIPGPGLSVDWECIHSRWRACGPPVRGWCGRLYRTMHSTLFDTYLPEYMWRKKFDGPHLDTFKNITTHIAQQYPQP